jgi:hypothetical protein
MFRTFPVLHGFQLQYIVWSTEGDDDDVASAALAFVTVPTRCLPLRAKESAQQPGKLWHFN